ncbi:uncharacterized protein [Nicotiana tomentosiformis]|uniref:uncharacterized protein n=1 Tax=Nicotiana tomentosiformis TaxID=4098 RepID=UPI00388C80D8
MDVVCHGQLYQNKMANVFNKRVKPRYFIPGKLVLKKIFPHQEESKGKFALNWQGPYVVHREGKFALNCQGPYVVHQVLSGEALILAEMDGRFITNLINSDAIKRYYV